jgi:hypothetical protein
MGLAAVIKRSLQTAYPKAQKRCTRDRGLNQTPISAFKRWIRRIVLERPEASG